MFKSARDADAAPTAKQCIRTLNEAELNCVSGGVRDNPYADRINQMKADQNKAQGTVGGSIGDPYVDGQPIF